MGGRGRSLKAEDKKNWVELIEEAFKNGAGIVESCNLIGLKPRTIQRWKKIGRWEDRRGLIQKVPPNRLQLEEKEHILKVLNSKEYMNLPPSVTSHINGYTFGVENLT